MDEDIHIAHLDGIIRHLRTTLNGAIRGYEQAVEELAKEGDYRGADWSEPYKYLSDRLKGLKDQARLRGVATN